MSFGPKTVFCNGKYRQIDACTRGNSRRIQVGLDECHLCQ